MQAYKWLGRFGWPKERSLSTANFHLTFFFMDLQFALNEQNGHRSATLVNLGKIAVRLGRKLRFDPVAQRFVGDEAANRFIEEPMRAPWRV